MSDNDNKLAAAVAAGAVTVAGVVAADQVVRARARARLGKDFNSDGTARVSAADRAAMQSATQRLEAGAIAALKTYTGHQGRPINKYMRHGTVSVYEADLRTLKALTPGDANYSKTAARLHSAGLKANEAVTQSRLPEGTRLFRGMPSRSLGQVAPGSVISDKGIVSTSLSLNQANRFSDYAARKMGGGAVLAIDAGGAKGINIEKMSHFKSEREVLLPSNTQLRVDRVEQGVRRHLFDAKRDYVFTSVVDRPLLNTAKQAMPAPNAGKVLAHLSTGAAVLAAGAHASLAYSTAKASGASEVSAIGQGIGAGAATAALPLAAGGAASLAVKSGLVSKVAMTVVGKAALPLSIAGTAAYYGWRAMQEGKGVSGTAKAAAWGALNGAIPVDLAMQAYGALKTPAQPGATAQGRQTEMTSEQKQSFASLNERFSQAQQAQSAQQADLQGPGKRGWANPKTQHAAQEGRRVKNMTDWAKA